MDAYWIPFITTILVFVEFQAVVLNPGIPSDWLLLDTEGYPHVPTSAVAQGLYVRLAFPGGVGVWDPWTIYLNDAISAAEDVLRLQLSTGLDFEIRAGP